MGQIVDDNQSSLRDILIPKTKQMVLETSFIFLFVHTFLFTIFSKLEFYAMIQYEIISVLIYAIAIMLLLGIPDDANSSCNRMLSNVIVLIIIELVIHSIVAIICLGSQYQFQTCIYGVMVLILFEHYISGSKPKSFLLIAFVILGNIVIMMCIDNYKPIYNTIDLNIMRFSRVAVPFLTMIFSAWYAMWISSTIFNYEKILEKKASYDKLTGLANRRYIDNIGYIKEQTYAAMIDIDDFKKFNDTYGHDVGDLVLRDLAKIMKSFRLSIDGLYPIRWGGEEFIIIYNTERGYEDFLEILESFIEVVRNSSIEHESLKLGYTITIGAAKGIDAISYEELIKIADEKLYIGKNSGKNRIIS